MPKVIAAILLLQSGGVDSSRPPTVTAVRVDRAPVVDGRLDDPEWNLAPAVTDFRQTDPDEGAPVSEATAVRVLYDGTAVYVGARLFDSAPARIVRRLARRDASTHSDEFRVFLDSYHDRRTAFQFSVNAAGVKKDVLIGDDGDFDDASWDPVWEAATSVDSLGWTAEIRIPLSQLRFSNAQDQVWGAHFVRWIERKQEQALFLLPLDPTHEVRAPHLVLGIREPELGEGNADLRRPSEGVHGRRRLPHGVPGRVVEVPVVTDQHVLLHARRVHAELERRAPIVVAVQEYAELVAVRGGIAPREAPHDPCRRGVEQARADVHRGPVVEHAHRRGLGDRCPFVGVGLSKVRHGGREVPLRVVQPTIHHGSAIDAHRRDSRRPG